MKSKKIIVAGLSVAMVMGVMTGCDGKTDTTDTTTTTVAGLINGTDATIGDPAADATTTAASEAVTYELVYVDKMTIDYSKYVDVSNWKNASVKAEDVELTDFEKQYYVAYALETTLGITREDITDRTVQAGDTVTIDFKGYVDGEELENGSGEGAELTIGSGQFIEGFESGLVGAAIGETVTLELAFPDPYPNNEELSGVPVKFDVTVKAISGYGEVADDAIASATASLEKSYATYDEYAASVIETAQTERTQNAVWQAVIDNCEQLAVNEELQEEYISTYLYYFSSMSQYYGVDMETFLYYYYGFDTVDAFKEALAPSAEQYAFQAMVVLGIADMENITVTEDDIIDDYNTELQNTYAGDEAAMTAAGNTKDAFMYDRVLEQVESLIYETIQVQ
ncbi:MAG: FKBP-type peptidyl-prolyl cis-trans isomerase [Lachnospiraceae bacterium]|nr:FKBP-type peptidyl-prolyl cis-trans isomerase [Lachnospiraceae bacterium]